MEKELTPEQLADTFVLIIQKWLTEEQISELRDKNSSLKDNSICASHDYCDANQAMINALDEHGITIDLQNEDQIALINKAWSIAKKNDFITRLQRLEDLVPVCPNCHAMFHKKTPPYSVDELKDIIRRVS